MNQSDDTWAKVSQSLGTLEQENVSLRLKLKTQSSNSSTFDTLNCLASGNAAIRLELMMAIDRKRLLLCEQHQIDQKLVESILGVSPVLNGATCIDSSMNHLRHKDLQTLCDDFQRVDDLTLCKALCTSLELLDDVKESIGGPNYVHFVYRNNNPMANQDALLNSNFSLGMEPGFVYVFDEEDSDENICFKDDQLSSATLEKLVERLTAESSDLTFRYVFMLTYCSFCSGVELLELLVQRLHVPLPPNLSAGEVRQFVKTWVAPVQIKVIGVLKYWVSEHFVDFEGDPELLKRLKSVVEEMGHSEIGKWCQLSSTYLSKLIHRKEMGGVVSYVESEKLLKPLINPNISYRSFERSFGDQNEEEIARQITLMDFAVFQGIQPRECLNQNWTKRKEEAPHLVQIIENFNKVSCWVQIEILSVIQATNRVQMIKKFLRIAEHLRAMNNFNALYAIHCGLNSNAVYRLKKTWALVPSRYMAIVDMLRDLFALDRKFATFRKTLQNAVTPCIPHIGIYLSDLTLISEGNDDFVGGRINFSKCRMIAKSIQWIQQYQQVNYPFQEIEAVQLYLQRNMEMIDPNELWRMSQDLENK